MNDTLIPTSLYDLSQKSHACDLHKQFEDLHLSSEKSKVYDYAVGMRDLFAAVMIDKVATLEDVDDLTAQITGYEFAGKDDEFDAENQALKNKTKKLTFHLKRYLRSEKRQNLVTETQPIDINLGDIYKVSVQPQGLFISHINGTTYIEAVWYENKKAPAGLSDGNTMASQVEQWDQKFNGDHYDEDRLKYVPLYLKQYAMLNYVKEMLKSEYYWSKFNLKKGDHVVAVGASYFMEMKSNDEEDYDFFDGHSNIFAMKEDVTIGKLSNWVSDEDKIIADYCKFHVLGKSADTCSLKDCEYCDINASCRFQKAPVKKEELQTTSNASKDVKPTDSQQKLLDIRKGNHLCIARAGSGKTAMLVKLFKNLLDNGFAMNEIFMTTFTKNAVAEFKERLVEELPPEHLGWNINDTYINTFHGFALKLIEEHYEECGFTDVPKEVNVVDQARTIYDLVTKKRITGPAKLYELAWDNILNVVHVALTLFQAMAEHPEGMDEVSPTSFYKSYIFDHDLVTDSTITELMTIYDDYRKALKSKNIILFSDMEPLMQELVEKYPEYIEAYGFRAMILDEWQDSNNIQMNTVRLFNRLPTMELTVAVGDDGQSIYAFRNANVDNITHFNEKLGKPVNVINMLENWRSTSQILSFADTFLDLNQNKTADHAVAGRKETGIKPTVQGFHSSDDEYKDIVEKIKKYHSGGMNYSNMCFITFKNNDITRMTEYLAAEKIPYVLRNPIKYMDNSRVKAALALINNAYYAKDATTGFFAYLSAKYDGDLLTQLTAEEVDAELDALKETFSRIEEKDEQYQRVLLHSYLDAIRQDDEIYISWLDEYVYKYRNIEEELDFISDFQKFGAKMTKRVESEYDGVVLITAHSSKGLEWKVVFLSLTSMDQEILHRKKLINELEERRRLIYVAMTRARDILHISGLYFLPGTKSRSAKDGGVIYNQFVHELYDIAGNAYDPVDHVAEAAKLAKKQASYEKRKAKYHKNAFDNYSNNIPGQISFN